MKLGAELGGYRVVTEPTNANAGMSQWARAERDDVQYFMKRYLAPKYPTPGSPGTSAGHARRRRECEAFEGRQLEIMDRLRNDVPGAGHLVTPRSFFRVGPSYYKVTDLVAVDESLSLAGCDPTDVAVAVRSLLVSLRVVHAAGVVHSDLKPDNVLFERTSAGLLTCKLIDFDESYLSGQPPEFVRLVGDPFFYSPEMLGYVKQLDAVKASSLTTASDVFAVAVLIHVLLTGNPPLLDSDTYAYPCEAVRDGQRPRLESAIGNGEAADALGQALALTAEARPTIDDLLAALTRSRIEHIVDSLRHRTKASGSAEQPTETVANDPADRHDQSVVQTPPQADATPSTDPTSGVRLRFNLGRQTPPST